MGHKAHQTKSGVKPVRVRCGDITPEQYLQARLKSIRERGSDPEWQRHSVLRRGTAQYRYALKVKPLLDAAWEQWNNKNIHGREILASL